ncbi:MAG: recombination protein O N-terminal domain-containing protein [Patescibacteria group bacterium]
MNNYYGTDAVVLASRERGEADMYLTFFTKDLGRIDAIATGVRLAKSKLRGHLTLFTPLRLMLTRGGSAWRLIDAEALVPVDNPTSHRKRCADFILRITGGEEPDLDLWDLVASINAVRTFSDEARFKIRALNVSGFLPDIHEQSRFFSARARAFILEKDDDTLFADPDERVAFEEGIEGILRANHMLYYFHGAR